MEAVGERKRGIAYQPALDGVRAVAVVLVLLAGGLLVLSRLISNYHRPGATE